MRFENQVAIITGAANGLGRAYALALAERGAKVALIDSSTAAGQSESLKSVVADIKTISPNVCCFDMDVTDNEAILASVSVVYELWGRVDILINNAGVQVTGRFEHLTLEDWQRQLDVDVTASFNFSKAVWPIMQQQHYGRILMTSAASGLFGDTFTSCFSAAKMALIGLVNGLHAEACEDNIHINSITPHALTSMTHTQLADSVKPLFSKSSVISTMLMLVSDGAPSGQHFLAAANQISHGQFVEFSPNEYRAGECLPETLMLDWQKLHQARPIGVYASGEAKVLSWAKLAAKSRHIAIE